MSAFCHQQGAEKKEEKQCADDAADGLTGGIATGNSCKPTLVLHDTVDIGVDSIPSACLNLHSEALENLMDIALMLLIEVAGQCVGSGIPVDLISVIMGKEA